MTSRYCLWKFTYLLGEAYFSNFDMRHHPLLCGNILMLSKKKKKSKKSHHHPVEGRTTSTADAHVYFFFFLNK